MKKILISSIFVLATTGCDSAPSAPPSADAVIPAGILQTNVVQAQLNNVIDCAQYPANEASERAEEYLPECRSWAQSRGYADAVVLPIDTAANEVDLASQPLTCPTLKEGNVGYYCVGLNKAAR